MCSLVNPQIGEKSVTETQNFNDGTPMSANAKLSMKFTSQTNGVYNINWSAVVNGIINAVKYTTNNCSLSDNSATINVPYGIGGSSSSTIGILPNDVPLPLTVSALSGSTKPFQAFSPVTGTAATWTVTWNFVPTAQYDVILTTFPDYSTGGWRPMAGRSETDVGNALVIQAEIVSKTTGQSGVQVTPDSWTFSIKDFSSEPGVALNWPPQNQVLGLPDLDFKDPVNATVYPNIGLSANGTSAQITPDSTNQGNLNHVQVILDSHDWGAWAKLNVTASIADQQVNGHFLGDTTTDILLPKRQQESFIADSWKDAHGVALNMPDSDDSENIPQGDGLPGDGLTLYEEYRGFYMGCSDNDSPPLPEASPGASCQHVEGNPNKKDLFVIDQIGSIADPGIELFQSISNLSVHYHGLKLDEVGPGPGPLYRAINFNFSAGPHEGGPGKYQHAVVLDWGPRGFLYGNTITTVNYVCPDLSHSCPALPEEVDHIEINPNLANDINGADFIKYVNTVAHELSHAVNVYHHGDVGHIRGWAIDNAQPPNVVECDLVTGACNNVTVMTEDQKPMSFAGVTSNFPLPKCPHNVLCLIVSVGNDVCASTGKVTLNGLHSGDQNSVMRYYNANAYIPDGSPNLRIWVGSQEAQDDYIGLQLTDHPAGTGVNSPPRPRYGDAYGGDGTANSGRGNDASQIDVNDNHAVNGAPPIIRPKQPVCPLRKVD
jgi:hypothetical protein